MITAEEARERKENHVLYWELDEIEKRIMSACMEGYNSTYYTCSDKFGSREMETMVNILQKHGFDAHYTRVDPADLFAHTPTVVNRIYIEWGKDHIEYKKFYTCPKCGNKIELGEENYTQDQGIPCITYHCNMCGDEGKALWNNVETIPEVSNWKSDDDMEYTDKYDIEYMREKENSVIKAIEEYMEKENKALPDISNVELLEYMKVDPYDIGDICAIILAYRKSQEEKEKIKNITITS